MLLGKPEIERYLKSGDIVIDPFVPANLGSAQYDVTIGEHIYREERFANARVYNPFDEEQVRRKWRLSKAIPYKDWDMSLNGIRPEDKLIMVAPGETILAHTNEYIGGACSFITTMMKARSSMGRNFFEVCKCAGMGDVGYFNRWTMEITNNSRFHTIPLVVGRRVAQILFFQVAAVDTADKYEQAGKYQSSASLDTLKCNWTPEQMLPKQWRDRECKE